ncbi:MAG: CocE/NonD family hydrolase [Actinomycetota bacterium]
MRKNLICLVSVLCMLLGMPAHASDPGYSRVDGFVEVAPGVHLEASVYSPTAATPSAGWPLIVRQHGGGSNKDSAYDVNYALEYIPRGFAVLMYSVRGHGGSEGTFDWFGPETIADFSKMLDWVGATFPTIDVNRTGTSGYSQGGGTSLLPAEFDARVKVVAAGNTFSSLNEALNPNGCFKLAFATAIFAAAYKVSASRTDDATALRWGATLYTDTEGIDPGAPPWVLPFPPPALPRPPYVPLSTSQELAGRSPITYMSSLVSRRVPVFWSNSWEDQLFPGDHPARILEPLEAAGIPTHYWFASGGHAAGANDQADEIGKEAAMLDWFDQYLRGVDHGFASRPKVDFAQRVPGTATWAHKTSASWPPASAPLTLHPTNGGSLSSSSDPTWSSTIVNDLANANIANDSVTSNEIAGRVGATGIVKSVPDSGTPVDTQTFIGPALPSALESTGSPMLHLSATSTAKKVTQIDAKVWDISPNGSSEIVNRGCWSGDPQRLSSLSLALWPNSHVWAAGHHIALSIGTVDFPVFEADKEPAAVTLTSPTNIEVPVTSG